MLSGRPSALLALAILALAPLAPLARAHAAARAPARPAPLRLADATPARVRARLGEPAIATGEGNGALWTYRRELCALMIFFTDDGRGLRVSAVSAAPRRSGEAPPELADCLESRPRF